LHVLRTRDVFLMELFNFFDLSDQMRYFDKSIDDLFDIFIDIYDLRYNFLDDLDCRRSKNNLRFLFVFVYLRNLLDNWD